MSVKYYLPVSVFHVWPQLSHTAARSLCTPLAELLVPLGGGKAPSPVPGTKRRQFASVSAAYRRSCMSQLRKNMHKHMNNAEFSESLGL